MVRQADSEKGEAHGSESIGRDDRETHLTCRARSGVGSCLSITLARWAASWSVGYRRTQSRSRLHAKTSQYVLTSASSYHAPVGCIGLRASRMDMGWPGEPGVSTHRTPPRMARHMYSVLSIVATPERVGGGRGDASCSASGQDEISCCIQT